MTRGTPRNLLLLGLTLVVLVAFSGLLPAEETVKCPVNGKEIKKSEALAKAKYEGKTYYFCCPGHKEEFLKNPEKYLEKKPAAEHMHGEHGEKTEHKETAEHQHAEHAEHAHSEHMHAEHAKDEMVADPVCGMKVKPSEAAAKAEYNGKTYYFCMEGCKEKFLADPEKYIKASGEMVRCTVTGEEVEKSKALTHEYEGKTYYFCCAGCIDTFKKDPAKYARKK